MMWLYSLLLAAGLIVSSPWWLMRMLTTERYREGMRQRLGRVPQQLRSAAAGFAEQRRLVWVHAVSVGEVLAASRLVSELEATLRANGEEWQIVVSTTTRTGQALARERVGANRVFYFPLDFAWAVRAYLRVLNPAVLVLMESEIWPRVLYECGRAGVPVVVANARVSDRSFSRAQRSRPVWGRVLRKVSLWLAQSEEDARRLVAMGARAECVRAIGNLKYDVRAAKETPVSEMVRRVTAGWCVVVVGSTVTDGKTAEEEVFLRAIAKVSPEFPLRYVLAPRHPERFDEAFAIANRWGRAVRAMELLKNERPASDWQVLVLDTIGDLAAVYASAELAFVGGSWVERGGHNPLEPAQFGVPVVMGPHYANFRDIVERLRTVDALHVVSAENILGEILRMFDDPDAAHAMGERGRQVFEAQQGATARAVQAIVSIICVGAKP